MKTLVKFLPLLGLVILAGWGLRPALAEKTDKPEKLPVVGKIEHKSYTETIPGTKVKFEMIAVPGGSYLRGSPKTEKDRKDDEGPQHPVTVGALWVGKCEVTWDEFDTFWRGRPGKKEDVEQEKPKDADAVTRPTPAYADETFGLGREGNPVICITHHCAMQYCRWLSIKTGKNYRLPTEAEWEWFARAGTTTAYSFGDDASKIGDYAWTTANSEDKPQPVGKKKANPWGLHDVHGNVVEWCIDLYQKDAYEKYAIDKLTFGPVVLAKGQRYSHVARGGSYFDQAPLCRSAARVGSNKDWSQLDPNRPQSIWWHTSAEQVGFRLVRPVTEQKELEGIRSLMTRESK
jgi:formylglycine-generating enzyme required for sulfatase activity